MVVPKALQLETLRKLHEGHQGIVRCQLRARTAMLWPGISQEINNFVKKCPECARDSIPKKEPLITTSLPEYPWQMVAADLCTLQGSNYMYLVVVDYFSRYPEVVQLRSTISTSVVVALKSTFARHGIPDVLMSDKGLQFSSLEFSEFAKQYNFSHSTSSPHYPASNGQAERAMQTIKHLLRNIDNPFMALLVPSHSTTLVCRITSRATDGQENTNYSPSDILEPGAPVAISAGFQRKKQPIQGQTKG